MRVYAIHSELGSTLFAEGMDNVHWGKGDGWRYNLNDDPYQLGICKGPDEHTVLLFENWEWVATVEHVVDYRVPILTPGREY